MSTAARLRGRLGIPARSPAEPLIDGYPFAVDRFGNPITLPNRGSGLRHLLIGGATGAGKSSYINALLAAAAADPCAAIIGADLKGGVELQPWEPRLTRLATDHDQLDQLAADLIALTRHRLDRLRAAGLRSWPVTLADPLVLVLIDELSEAFAEDLERNPPPVARAKAQQRRGRLESLARLGRAAGIVLVSATQRPAADLISPDYRANHGAAVLLWVRNVTIGEMVVGELPKGLDPTTALSLDIPGMAWWWPAGTALPRTIRAPYLDDQAVAARAAATAHLRHPWAAIGPPPPPAQPAARARTARPAAVTQQDAPL